MNYLLDTNMLSRLMQLQGSVVTRMSALPVTDVVVICTVTRGEILFGIEIMPSGRRRQNLAAQTAAVLKRIMSVQIPEAAADNYAKIKAARKLAGRPILENDLWIASTAMAIGAVLVSHDNDMQGIAGLTIEDWW